MSRKLKLRIEQAKAVRQAHNDLRRKLRDLLIAIEQVNDAVAVEYTLSYDKNNEAWSFDGWDGDDGVDTIYAIDPDSAFE